MTVNDFICMKKRILILLLLLPGFCWAQNSIFKQIIIPLNNSYGVPYEEIETGYDVIGFDVDNKDEYYFLGGSKTTLAVFSDNKLKYRTDLKGLNISGVYLQNNTLWGFGSKYDFKSKKSINDLYKINLTKASAYSKKSFITDQSVNYFQFVDSCLVLEFCKIMNGPSIFEYKKYDLSCNFITSVQNRFALPINIYSGSFSQKSINYLGNWKGGYLFESVDSLGYFKFFLLDKNGQLMASKSIVDKMLGNSFAERPDDFIKFRFNAIYVLGYRGKNAVITKIPMDKLFQ